MKNVITSIATLVITVAMTSNLNAQDKAKEKQVTKIYVHENKAGKETTFEANELTPEVEKKLKEMGIDVNPLKVGSGFSMNTKNNSEEPNKVTVFTFKQTSDDKPLLEEEMQHVNVTTTDGETRVVVNGEEVFVDKNKSSNKVIKVLAYKVVFTEPSAEDFKKAGIPETEKPLTISDLRCLPNPSSGGVFNLSFKSADVSDANLEVRDINGKRIRTETLKNNNGEFSTQLNLGNEPKGIYFATLTQNGKVTTKKLVIN